MIVHIDNRAVTTWDEDSRVPIQSLRDILVFSWIFNLVFHLQVHLTDLVFIVHSHGKCPLLERRGSAILRGDIDLEANLVEMVHRSECLSGVTARLQESTVRAGQEELLVHPLWASSHWRTHVAPALSARSLESCAFWGLKKRGSMAATSGTTDREAYPPLFAGIVVRSW